MCFSISFPGELLGLERGVRLRLGRAAPWMVFCSLHHEGAGPPLDGPGATSARARALRKERHGSIFAWTTFVPWKREQRLDRMVLARPCIGRWSRHGAALGQAWSSAGVLSSGKWQYEDCWPQWFTAAPASAIDRLMTPGH